MSERLALVSVDRTKLAAMAHKSGARLTRQYTDEEVNALLHAVLVDGLRQSEAERRAIAGTLKPGLAPFGRPRFAYPLIRRGRERFEATNDQALDSGAGTELKRLTRLALAKARELDKDSDPAEIARRAKALAETHKALRGAEGKTRAPTNQKARDSERVNETETKAQSQADVLAQLSQLAAQRDTASTTPITQDSGVNEGRGPVPSLAH